MKKIRYLIVYLLIILSPIYVFAYDKVIPGGETIGIEVHSRGVLVVGFYKVDNKYIGKDSGFRIGDVITKVNNKSINNISSMMSEITSKNIEEIDFTVVRDGKSKHITMKLDYNGEAIRTGLYVKDQINGLGTLSFILEDNRFAGLGHEIMESNTLEKFDISNGEIYDASVSEIIKSYNGQAGEKNATYDKSEVTGIITDNEATGIYGKYKGSTEGREFVDIKKPNEVRVGPAVIRTVIDKETIEEFNINIISLDLNDLNKNILFEIVDDKLLNKTGGVVQGMSGSPIMQDNKMIGVVNYVIVNEPSKGYGIFITKMLEEIE